MKTTIHISGVLGLVLLVLTSITSCSNQFDDALSPSENESLVQQNKIVTRASSNVLPFLKGADLSYANELEDNGVIFKENGSPKDVYALFKQYGANTVRLRLWHNPSWTKYSTLKDVIKSAKRAKAQGLNILLDFHYSDTWTDPEQNTVPAAWLSVVDNTPVLADSVYQYTYNTLKKLKSSSVLPALVQIGNETNKNIMVRDNFLLTPIDYSRNVALFNAGLKAVADFNNNYGKNIKTILHVAMSPGDAQNWIKKLQANGISNFDILGLSYYPEWQSYTPVELGQFTKLLKSNYNIQLLVAETGHIWTRKWNDNNQNLMSTMAPGYPEAPCPQLQKDFLIEVKNAVKDNGGIGVMAWEPEWVSASNVTLWGVGSNWENVTFFDFNNELLTHGGIEFLTENNVKVTFSIDMSATSGKAYITGEFTKNDEGNWQILPMKQVSGTNTYTFTTWLTQGQIGGYYFLNDSTWTAREDVPVSERKYGNDRGYEITSSAKEQTINCTWK